MGRVIFWVLLAAWAAAWLWSLTAFGVFEPAGEGWERGLNRITHFLGWQIAALVLALLVLLANGVWAKGSVMRWLGRLPVILAGLLIAACAGLILYANFVVRPPGPVEAAPAAPAAPTALPAEPLDPEPAPEP